MTQPLDTTIAAHAARLAEQDARDALDLHRDRTAENQPVAGRVLLTSTDDELPYLREIERTAADRTAAEVLAGGRVYRIPAANLPSLTDAVSRLARRAVRLDLAPLALTESGEEHVQDTDDDGLPIVRSYTYATIAGTTPILDGWTFLAVLEHTDAGTIIRRVPTLDEAADDLTAYRHADPLCEHCDTIRQRANTYLVRHTDGEIRQVGSSCVRDFTGHRSADAWARLCELIADLAQLGDDLERDDDAATASGASVVWTTLYLAYAAHDARENGWVSRSVARDHGKTATADHAATAYRLTAGRNARDLPSKLRPLVPGPEDHETAERVIAWVRDDLATRDDLSDYEHNVVTVLAADAIPDRQLGIAASAITAEQRNRERVAERKAAAAEDRGHFGTIGERVEIGVTVESVRWTEGEWGSTTIYKLRTDDGYALTWFASRDTLGEAGSYVIRATIAKHEEYRGVAETHVKRCAIRETREAPVDDDTGPDDTAERAEEARRLRSAADEIVRAAHAGQYAPEAHDAQLALAAEWRQRSHEITATLPADLAQLLDTEEREAGLYAEAKRDHLDGPAAAAWSRLTVARRRADEAIAAVAEPVIPA